MSSFRLSAVLPALCAAILLLAAGARPSSAETSAGIRAGLSVDPDQVLFGGQLNLEALSEHVYIVPSAEAGFGDDAFTLSFNGDVQYRFDTQGDVRPYAGGGLALFYWNADNGGDGTEFGVDVLGGIFFGRASGNPMFVEAKASLTDDTPDWKFIFGVNF